MKTSEIMNKPSDIISCLKGAIKDLNDAKGITNADDNKMVDAILKIHKSIKAIENMGL